MTATCRKFLLLAFVLALASAFACTRETADGSDNGNADDVAAGDETAGQDTQIPEDDAKTPPDGQGKTDQGGNDDNGEQPQDNTVEKFQKDPQGLECAEGTAFINILQAADLPGVVATTQVVSAGDTLDGFYAEDPDGGEYSGIKIVFDKGVIADVAPGDVFEFNGDLKEYYCMTEFEPLSFTKTGTASVPDPEVLLPEALAAANPATEPWESVLVKVENVQVVSAPDNHGIFEVTGGVMVDDVIYEDLAALDVGCTYKSITGVVEYAFGQYVLLPRGEADLVPGEGECGEPPVESDTIKGIQGSDESKTCEDVQFGFSKNVSVKGLVITGPGYVVSKDKYTGFWAFDGEGGKYSGVLLVFKASENPQYAIGDKIDVTGKWQEYWCLTEIMVETATDAGKLQGEIPVAAATAEEILADGESFEGTLVSLTGVTVTDEPDQYGGWKVTGGLWVDDDMEYTYEPKVGDELATLTGVITYSFDNYRLLPRSDADIVVK